MDPVRFLVPNAVEQKSGTYTAALRDENGAPVSSNVLTSFLLTLYDNSTSAHTIINGRNGQNVLNANQVTVDLNGTVTWVWLPADMPIINPNRVAEDHIALFEAKWQDTQGRPRQLNHEVWFTVNRIPQLV